MTRDPETAVGPAAAWRLFDYFLHSSLHVNPDTLLRARILVASQCALIVFNILIIPFFVLAPVPAISRQIGIPICAAAIAGITPLLFKLKRDGSYSFCGKSTVWIYFFLITLGVFFTGGVNFSPATHMLMGPPLLMGFFFGGIRTGGTVAGAGAVLLGIGLWLEQNSFIFPQVLTQDQLGLVHCIIVMICIMINGLLVFFYEHISHSVRRARDREHQKIRRIAHTDLLTGLANRLMFDETIIDRISSFYSGRSPARFSICFIDLNNFKPINDRHGHSVGDEVLRAVSIRLRSSLRGADLIGRMGGDEFILLLDELECGPQMEILAKRFLEIISQPIETSAGLLSVSASLGFACFPAHGDDLIALKKAADIAMYRAKNGHHGWCTV